MAIQDFTETRSIKGLYDLMEIVLDRLARIESFQERLMRIETHLEKDRIARINSQSLTDFGQRQTIPVPPLINISSGLSLDLFPRTENASTISLDKDSILLSGEQTKVDLIGSESESSLSDFESTETPLTPPKESTQPSPQPHGQTKRKRHPPLIQPKELAATDSFITRVRAKRAKRRFIQPRQLDNYKEFGVNRLHRLVRIQANLPSSNEAKVLLDEIRETCKQHLSKIDLSRFHQKSDRPELYLILEQLVDKQYCSQNIHLSYCTKFWGIKRIVNPLLFQMLNN
ncbi:hypothetical protein A0J61_07543 [Choanephora cucurbitarum]|uniref:Uncharacterized protein n=1 Tax=Choanephora cucurbitarum TaxID=101091 RepID=A0A1C7N6Y2_9FUNG|nr:hypothetical protein A0J61_07543 [Choanephora cucurbitarum]